MSCLIEQARKETEEALTELSKLLSVQLSDDDIKLLLAYGRNIASHNVRIVKKAVLSSLNLHA